MIRCIDARWTLVGLVAILSGCGGGDRPELGYVTGKVTMEGEPLGNIIVVMKPEVGRAAMVRANDEGMYDIEYVHGVRGTKVGPTTVTFEWPLGYEGPTKPIPRKYTGVDSAIKIDVKPGKNTFDFDLEPDPNPPQRTGPIPD
jgi:hypothetical protein